MVVISPQTRIVALDIETTGLSSVRHRIVELAAVSWENGQETGYFETLVNPGCFIPREVIRVHGITDDMVRDKPFIHEVLPAFKEFCAADVMVAHNSPFDVSFINAECVRNGLPPFMPTVVDSCSLARKRLPGCPNYKLETLKSSLGIGRGQAHRALDDARDCLAIFLCCLKQEAPELLPIEPPPLREELVPLATALRTGGTIVIDYRDMRGKTTRREIRPLFIDEHNVIAHCMLRDDKRHFALNRIRCISSR